MGTPTRDLLDLDALVIGSGFGGSVAALRLAEKGYRVAVLEQGRRITPRDMDDATTRVRKLLWAPRLGMFGYFMQRVLRHVAIVGGVGVGGGSLVYGAVLLEPKPEFFADPLWRELGIDAQAELAPHYQTAARMLGRTLNPMLGRMDHWLEGTARRMGVHDTYGPVPLGVYFGEPGVTAPDPYFAGEGPPRTGCTACARCLTGCPSNAKNTLDKNYLHLAAAAGATIHPLQRALAITPLPDGAGYEVETDDPMHPHAPSRRHRAKLVFIAAGVLGTVELLSRCRVRGSLPNLSPRLGEDVRTNSEAIVAILADRAHDDLLRGPAISSHLHANAHTHVTQNRFPRGYEFMKWYMGPLVDGERPVWRALSALARLLLRPDRTLRNLLARPWHARISALTVMQSLDNRMALDYRRSWLWPFRRRLVSDLRGSARPPSYLAEANAAARAFAAESGGQAMNLVSESVANLSTTAHVLGGACMGPDPSRGVVDAEQRVFGYPGLYVVDGSAIPINVGVNPSLTITAMAERCLAAIPPHRRAPP